MKQQQIIISNLRGLWFWKFNYALFKMLNLVSWLKLSYGTWMISSLLIIILELLRMLFIMQSLHQKDNVKFRYKKGFTSQLVFFSPKPRELGPMASGERLHKWEMSSPTSRKGGQRSGKGQYSQGSNPGQLVRWDCLPTEHPLVFHSLKSWISFLKIIISQEDFTKKSWRIKHCMQF